MPGWDWFYKFRHKNTPGEVNGYGSEAEKSQGMIYVGKTFFYCLLGIIRETTNTCYVNPITADWDWCSNINKTSTLE